MDPDTFVAKDFRLSGPSDHSGIVGVYAGGAERSLELSLPGLRAAAVIGVALQVASGVLLPFFRRGEQVLLVQAQLVKELQQGLCHLPLVFFLEKVGMLL